MWKLLITQAKPYTVAGFFLVGGGGGGVKMNIYFIASILYFKTRRCVSVYLGVAILWV